MPARSRSYDGGVATVHHFLAVPCASSLVSGRTIMVVVMCGAQFRRPATKRTTKTFGDGPSRQGRVLRRRRLHPERVKSPSTREKRVESHGQLLRANSWSGCKREKGGPIVTWMAAVSVSAQWWSLIAISPGPPFPPSTGTGIKPGYHMLYWRHNRLPDNVRRFFRACLTHRTSHIRVWKLLLRLIWLPCRRAENCLRRPCRVSLALSFSRVSLRELGPRDQVTVILPAQPRPAGMTLAKASRLKAHTSAERTRVSKSLCSAVQCSGAKGGWKKKVPRRSFPPFGASVEYHARTT
jgi:hypothetical protein